MSIDRRRFLQLTGGAFASLATFKTDIAKALDIPANNRTGTIKDVEHIVILMQENRPFDHHFGTLQGVRGFNDPRAAKIHLPLKSGRGSKQVPVFLQPAGPGNEALGFAVPPDSGNLGGPAGAVGVIPPFRIKPESVSPGLKSLGGLYMPGTDHSWNGIHAAWNDGQYDQWAVTKGPMAMSYMTRDDLPVHFALADAFTVGDNYFCSVMGPTNPNRMYMWSGCIGNLKGLGPGGADGHGAGPMTYNGLSINDAFWTYRTFPEVLQDAGVTWKMYQDLAGPPGPPFFGDGEGFGNPFTGNFADGTVLYFNQYGTATPGSPLFDNGATGTNILSIIPPSGAPKQDWVNWADHLFDDFRKDVEGGTLPQVSWIAAPAGYTEHSDWPINYGAWYIAQIFNILVSNPDLFSKTVFLINYDEGDGSWDHIVSPTPPRTPAFGASTVSIENEIVNADGEPEGFVPGPIGLSTRVPLIAISPWSKGGFVNSQLTDHTSLIKFIEKRFGVFEPNISPWRRAIVGDLSSAFNFSNPNHGHIKLQQNTVRFLPSVPELGGASVPDFIPTLDTVTVGVPPQEKGVRPARALPYELDVHAKVNAANHTVVLKFTNTGGATVVFQVRSANPADLVRTYTVEPGKHLSGTWSVGSSYDLSVYGPNGFLRSFKGTIGTSSAALDIVSKYGTDGRGSIALDITNVAAAQAEVTLLDAYTGQSVSQRLRPQQTFEYKQTLDSFGGWYDLIVRVWTRVFKYQLAGHVETGKDSISDPALGGLVTLTD
jgi:phospholipase C